MLLLCATALQGQQKAVSPLQESAQGMRCASPQDDAALRRIPEEWKLHYNNGDAAGVAALYAEGAYYLTQHFATGIVHGRAAIRAYVQIGVDAHYRVDSIEVLAISCSKDLAYVIDRYTSTNAGQQAIGVNLVVLKKTEGQWLIAAHEAAVPDPATAIQRLPANQGQS
jgi:uncharacterized protein (TIGR02246 family)